MTILFHGVGRRIIILIQCLSSQPREMIHSEGTGKHVQMRNIIRPRPTHLHSHQILKRIKIQAKY